MGRSMRVRIIQVVAMLLIVLNSATPMRASDRSVIPTDIDARSVVDRAGGAEDNIEVTLWANRAPAPGDIVTVQVRMSADPVNNVPSGVTGEVIASVIEVEQGAISHSASAYVTRHRPPAQISIHNPVKYLRPNGDSTAVHVTVLDEQGVAVADGTEVRVSATNGSIAPLIARTSAGYVEATFTTSATTGAAIVTASTSNGLVATTTLISAYRNRIGLS